MIHAPVTNDRSIEPRRQHPLNNNSLHSTILSWWRNRRRQSPSRHNNNHDEDGDDDDDDDDDGRKEPEDEVRMRVAITIALPSPEYPVHINNNNNGQKAVENNNMDRQNMTDYCIGTYECPWH